MNRRQMLVFAVIATASLVAQNQFFDERYYERTRLTTTLLGSAYNGNTLLAYGEGVSSCERPIEVKPGHKFNCPIPSTFSLLHRSGNVL